MNVATTLLVAVAFGAGCHHPIAAPPVAPPAPVEVRRWAAEIVRESTWHLSPSLFWIELVCRKLHRASP